MKKLTKRLALLLALCLLAAAAAACTSSSPKEEDKPQPDSGTTQTQLPAGDDGAPFTLTIAQSSDPQTLDPHKSSGDIGANVFRNVCETLIFYDEDWNTYCLLADSYEQVSDTEWLFHLRENIQFSNGEPFDAEAVIWNFERAASEEYARQSFEYKKYISDIEAVDSLTVKFTLTQPDIFFVQHVAEVPMLAPAHSQEIGEEAIGRDIVGTGPYVFVSWEADTKIVLERNPDYWGDAPAIDKVVFRTIPEAATRVAEMVNGNVDIIMNVQYESTAMLESSGSISVIPKKMNRTEYIGFNTYDWCETPALQNKLVRQALNYAVDVDAIIENIMGGFGERVSTIWRSDYAGFNEELAQRYTYDPDKARSLLEEAGYKDGFDVTLMTDTDNHAKAQEVTEAVGAYLTAIGLNVDVQVLDDTTAYAIIVNGQDAKQCPGLFDWNWGSKPGLYESTLTGVLSSEGISSYNQIPGYDELVNKIIAESTPEGREPYLAELQELLADDPPALYLFRLYDIYGVSSRVDWDPNSHYAMLVREMRIAK